MAALAPLLRALGYRVHERDDIDWVEYGLFSLMPMPSTRVVTEDPLAIELLLRLSGQISASFVTCEGGTASMAWWVRDPDYGLSSVQRQFRQNLRRGEGRVVVRPLSWGELRMKGLAVHRSVASARGVPSLRLHGPDAWNTICSAAAATAGAEATGCFVDGELAAFMLSVTSAGVCEGLLAEVSPHHSEARPAHALYHGFAMDMIRRPGVTAVTVGRQSIPPHGSLDAFKRHAGFVAEPIHVGVVLHPRWRWLAAGPVRGGLHTARRLLGGRVPQLNNVDLIEASLAGLPRRGGR